MADGFRIASGFVEVTMEDRTQRDRERIVQEIASIRDRRVQIDANIQAAQEHLDRLREEAETATGPRRIEIDALTGTALRQLQLLRDEADRLDGRRIVLDARVNQIDESTARIKRFKDQLDRMEESLFRVYAKIAQVGSLISGVTSLLGPLSVGFANAAIATGQFLADLTPLAALLPGFAASIGVVTVAAKAMGPAFSEALEPIRTRFEAVSLQVGRLAVQGLPALADAFVRVNMPTIAAGMQAIGRATNEVVTEVGRWVNSTAGQQAIANIMRDVSLSAEALAPSISRVVIAFGNFIARVGDPLMTGLSNMLDTLARKTAGWVDTLDMTDVQKSFDRLAQAGNLVVDKFRAIKEIIGWIADNQDSIRKFSDALAGVGIVVGIATGGWVAAVAGAITLILNHFDTFKSAMKGVSDFAVSVFNTISNDPWVKKIVQDIKDIGGIIRDDFAVALKEMGEAWGKIEPYAKQAWAALGPFIDKALKNPEVQRGIRIWVEGLTAIVAAFVAAAAVLPIYTGILTGAFGLLIAWLTGTVAGRFVSFVKETIANAKMAQQWLGDTWDQIQTRATTAWNSTITYLQGIPARVGSVWDSIRTGAQTKWNEIVTYVQGIPGRITSTISGAWASLTTSVSTTFDAVKTSIQQRLTDASNSVQQFVTDLPYKIGFMAGQVVGQFVTLGAGILVAVASFPGVVAAKFVEMKDRAVQEVTAMVDSVVSWVQALPGRASAAISSLVSQVTAKFTETKTQATTQAQGMVDTVVSFFQALPGRAASALSSLASQVSAKFTDAKTQAIAQATELVNSAVSTLQALPGRAASALSTLASQVTAKFNEAKTSAITAVTTMINQVVSTIAGLPARAAAAVSGIGGTLRNAGAQLIQGFIDGIQSKIPDVSGTLSGLTSQLPSWKGPPEKDARILEPSGRLVMSGFMRGIGAQTPALRQQLADITGMLGAAGQQGTGGGAGSVAGVGAGGGRGVVYQFAPGSITLDASKIKTLQDLLTMIDGIRPTARQFGAVPVGA